jgi:hypothetical protein
MYCASLAADFNAQSECEKLLANFSINSKYSQDAREESVECLEKFAHNYPVYYTQKMFVDAAVNTGAMLSVVLLMIGSDLARLSCNDSNLDYWNECKSSWLVGGGIITALSLVIHGIIGLWVWFSSNHKNTNIDSTSLAINNGSLLRLQQIPSYAETEKATSVGAIPLDRALEWKKLSLDARKRVLRIAQAVDRVTAHHNRDFYPIDWSGDLAKGVLAASKQCIKGDSCLKAYTSKEKEAKFATLTYATTVAELYNSPAIILWFAMWIGGLWIFTGAISYFLFPYLLSTKS